MRALLRPFALHAAYTPIETIVFFSIIGTLAYFHILSAIKHSAFLAPTHTSTPALRPAHALYRLGEWVGVRENSRTTPIEIQQVVISLDAVHRYRDVIPADISLASEPLSSSTLNLTNYLTHSLQSTNGRTYPSICHRPVQHSVNRSFGAPTTTPCFTHQQANDRTFTQTLSFHPGLREEFVSVLARRFNGDGHGRVFSDEAGVRFEVESAKGAEPLAISQMRRGKWVAYAARALVIRFWDLAKKADSLDIVLILAGYILMHITFYLLLTRSRRLGSSFWLPLAILSSAILALLIALPIAMYLRIPIDPVALTEALPFLVCTVGFDKPLRLARAVFTHPHLTSPMPSGSSLSAPTVVNGTGQLKPAPKIITESLTLVYPPIIRDYILEIAVLVVGANSKVGGLREVCALAALILGVDCMLLCTYLAAILGVMIEVRRIKTVSRAMTRSRSSSVSSSSGKPSAMVRPAPPATPLTLRHKISSALLGEKGSSVPGYAAGTQKSLHVPVSEKQENPVARLKLLLIASFLTLHILNLITPLTPSRTNTHTTPPHVVGVNVRKVDITAPGIRSVLQSLVDASSANLEPSDGNSSETDEDSAPFELLVKIPPPIYIRVLPPAHLLPARIGLLEGEHLTGRRSTGEWLEWFMSSWTRLVGDPILSKWIVVVLAISISLNGYLLKGIALGVGVRAFGVVGRSGVVKGGVRFDEGEEVQHQPPTTAVVTKLAPVSPTRGPTSPAPAPSSVATFTLEDVDRKLKATKRLSSTSTKPAATCTPPLSSSDSDPSSASDNEGPQEGKPDVVRSLEECVDIFENGPRPQSVALSMLNDEEVVLLAQHGKIAAYALEKVLGMDELERAVRIRRALISRASLTQTLETSDIPMANYDYSRVLGACCENVVGYIPIPLGIAGPLNVDGTLYPIPMATAEGTLVASTSRGCKALNAGGGVTTVVVQDAMTRGPAIDFPTVVMASEAKAWIASEEGYNAIKTAFESTSRFAKLKSLKTAMAGRTLFVRFATATGDAMGMNMISKGTEKGLEVMQKYFPDMVVLALSGNYCTDKKPAAINWIEGRGKSVVAEAVIPGKVVKTVLKTTVEALCNLNTKKNLVGSAMAGSIGGFNAHAANILTAVFLATGQDPAQNVESSNCMTLMEPVNKGEDLLMTITMPSIEVGTVGGGTVLGPQQGVLELLGMKGAHPTHPGQNAQALARLIAAAVMAGELSLLSALAAGHLIRAHMAHNRSQTNTPAPSLPPTPAPGAGAAFAGQLAPLSGATGKRKGSLGAQLGPLTPSSSTGSLPPYSARP